jgi:predicted phosphoribosyltransferase
MEIISHYRAHIHFQDRQEAGEGLAWALEGFAWQDIVVYALPRGGVVLGRIIADMLHAPLDLLIVRKIGHPLFEEYAVCAIGESEEMLCNEVERAELDDEWFAKAKEKELAEIVRRRKVYMHDRPRISAKGKVAILVDDGIATGLTMCVAIRDIRRDGPEKIIVAVPVMSREIAALLRRNADELVTLAVERYHLGAVGAYYDDFPQLTDGEVISLLDQ